STRQKKQTKYCLCMPFHNSKKVSHEDKEAAFEKMKQEIEASQECALQQSKVLHCSSNYCSPCIWQEQQLPLTMMVTPVAVAIMDISNYYIALMDAAASVSVISGCCCYLLSSKQIESHVKWLDEDLNQFAEDLKQESKIPPDEPAILPPLPIVTKDEKRKAGYITPQSKRLRQGDWERERDMDLELMPPPSSHKKNIPASVVDQPIDPNEPTYCICHQVSFGDMIACDNENCGGEWFHYSCVGLTPETRFKGKWFCPTCRNQQ
ncbi:PHD finger protein ING2-like, partial [Elaeis guineensis]|uniref:PHD finger protein ING2-like n=1 Tax=Elaeis guineensis var. tenera TaxID=51953 RepID=UPI003C6D0585